MNFVDPKSKVYPVVTNVQGCHIWMKPPDANGYVHLKGPHGQREKAYKTAKGEIPQGYMIDHTCHNEALSRGECVAGVCAHRACINPEHLEAVTSAENIRRGKAALTQCAQGHSLVDPGNLGASTKQRRCLACHRIETRIARGKTETEAAAMEIKYQARTAPAPAA